MYHTALCKKTLFWATGKYTNPVLCKVVIELKVTERSTMAPVSGILQHPLLFLPNAVFIYVKPANLVPGKRHQNATPFF